MTTTAGGRRKLPTSVPLCDLDRQIADLEPDLLAAAQRVLRSGRFILGDEEQAFCAELADYLGVRHAIGVASGTDALTLALRASGLRPGDRVITSPFSFFATAEAIVLAGGEPVFCDIDPLTYNLDPTSVQAVLDGASVVHQRLAIKPESIRAIIPVHLFGHPAGVVELRALADPRGIVVVEDAAQALGSTLENRHVGTVGQAGCFSFFPSKNLGGFGDGGAVVTDADDLASSLLQLRAHGASSGHHHDRIGTNSRLDELQAALLRVKLPHLECWLERRRTYADMYSAALCDLPGLSTPANSTAVGHSFGQYTLRVGGGKRDDLRRHLDCKAIGSAVYYPLPLHLQEALRYLNYKEGDLPIAERAAKEVLSLPMHPDLTQGEIDRVVTAIREFVS